MKYRIVIFLVKTYIRRKIRALSLFWCELLKELATTKKLLIAIVRYVWEQSTPGR